MNNEDPLTRLGQREPDVPRTYNSNHQDYRSEAGTTNLAADHRWNRNDGIISWKKVKYFDQVELLHSVNIPLE